jgi:hypothetical protein
MAFQTMRTICIYVCARVCQRGRRRPYVRVAGAALYQGHPVHMQEEQDESKDKA